MATRNASGHQRLDDRCLPCTRQVGRRAMGWNISPCHRRLADRGRPASSGNRRWSELEHTRRCRRSARDFKLMRSSARQRPGPARQFPRRYSASEIRNRLRFFASAIQCGAFPRPLQVAPVFGSRYFGAIGARALGAAARRRPKSWSGVMPYSAICSRIVVMTLSSSASRASSACRASASAWAFSSR